MLDPTVRGEVILHRADDGQHSVIEIRAITPWPPGHTLGVGCRVVARERFAPSVTTGLLAPGHASCARLLPQPGRYDALWRRPVHAPGPLSGHLVRFFIGLVGGCPIFLRGEGRAPGVLTRRPLQSRSKTPKRRWGTPWISAERTQPSGERQTEAQRTPTGDDGNARGVLLGVLLGLIHR